MTERAKLRPQAVDAAAIVERLRAGESQRSVAADFGLNPVTVGAMGRQAGLVFARGRKSAEARRGVPIRQTERAFQSQVVELAGILGWLVYHTWLSKHSTAGFPDLVLVRPPRVLFAELKSDLGRLMPAQSMWLSDLRDCPGVEVALWRPADLEEIARVLR